MVVLKNSNKIYFRKLMKAVKMTAFPLLRQINLYLVQNQFEEVFYMTLTEESQITTNFVSKVFYNSSHSKFLADFASSITTDQSDAFTDVLHM